MKSFKPLWITECCRRAVAAVFLVSLFASLAGCEVIGLAAVAIVPPTKAPVHQITDRPLLVIVDDPQNMLRDPQLALVVAANCTATLRAEEVVKQGIETEKLVALAIEMGDRYAKTSPYDIGRQLGAKQVMVIHIFKAQTVAEPGLLRPAADVGVKLFDVDSKMRMFPADGVATGNPDRGVNEGYFMHKVTLRHRVTEANADRVDAISRRQLAEEIGLRTALLFFEHDPQRFEDIRS